MNEIDGSQAEQPQGYSALLEKIKQLFIDKTLSLRHEVDSTNRPFTRRAVLRGSAQMMAGILLEPMLPKAQQQLEPPTRSIVDFSRLIPENVHEFLELRKIIRDSRELLHHPEFFFPVSLETALPLRFFDNINQLDLKLVEGNLVGNVAFKPLQEMLKSARELNLLPKVISGFRSYEFQKDIVFEPEVLKVKLQLQAKRENNGLSEKELTSRAEEIVSRYSSKPGHSQHHLGIAFDIVDENIPEFDDARNQWSEGWYGWLRNNAHLYGFVLAYPRGKDNVTAKPNSGYASSEPWHVRFVGKPLAQYLYQQDYLAEDTEVTVQSVLFKLYAMSQYGYK